MDEKKEISGFDLNDPSGSGEILLPVRLVQTADDNALAGAGVQKSVVPQVNARMPGFLGVDGKKKQVTFS
jgi:hypothetical protein